VLRDVVDRHARRVYRAARGMGFTASDAEDLAQEVFVTFLDTLDRFEGRAQVGTWLFGILHHKAQERRRLRGREELADPIEDAFEAEFDAGGGWIQSPVPADRLAASRETADALSQCLTELSDEHRAVFQLRQVEGLTAAEVSEILGCTTTNVGVMFHRVRLRLRACLEGKGWGHS
jgi:RNA polymerase sigma-70 factor (ECF subfamily)